MVPLRQTRRRYPDGTPMARETRCLDGKHGADAGFADRGKQAWAGKVRQRKPHGDNGWHSLTRASRQVRGHHEAATPGAVQRRASPAGR
jgi:hypothetical protein